MNRKHLQWFAALTAVILLIPLIGMLVSDEVDWGFGDFLFIGILLFGSGLVYELITTRMRSPGRRIAAGIVIIGFVIFVWGMAAVGLEYVDTHYASPIGQQK